MICRRCKCDKAEGAFRLKKHGAGERYLAKVCRVCENADAKKRAGDRTRRRLMAIGKGRPDREDWHVLRAPWPWEPGTKVFEDVQLRRAA